MPRDAEVEPPLGGHVEDHGLDEDLPLRAIQRVDHCLDRPEVARRRGDDERVRGLVGAHLRGGLEHRRGRIRRCSTGPSVGTRARARAARPADRLVDRADDLLRVRVLQHHHPDLRFVRRRDVDLLEHAQDAIVGAARRDDHERVWSFDRDDASDVERPPGRHVVLLLQIEDLVELLLDLGSRQVP